VSATTSGAGISIVLPDVSEFQGKIDWAKLVAAAYPAVIIRMHNGRRADEYATANRAGAKAAGAYLRGLYQYLVKDRDAATQANEFCDLIGTLEPGEWPICDLEEGDGDQSGRLEAWMAVVARRLGGVDWAYSGEYFWQSHNLAAARLPSSRTWIAAYGGTEPTAVPHELWQYTDTRSFPGIASACDASIFHGTAADLAALINPEADMPLTPADAQTVWAYKNPSAKPAEVDMHQRLIDTATQSATAAAQATAAAKSVAAVSTTVAALEAQVQALTSQVTAITKALAALTPAAIAQALAADVVHVDVTVNGTQP